MAVVALPSTLHLTMPEPPSANRYWRHVGTKVLLAKEAREYRAMGRVAYAESTGTLRVRFPEGPIAITLRWFRGRKSGDLDNRIKQALDALAGCAYTDDSQIEELHCFRYDAPRKARLEVTISRPIP